MKIIFALLFTLNTFGSGNVLEFDHSHSKLTEILKTHISQGKVSSLFNYKKMSSNLKPLNSYLKDLESLNKNQFNHFTQNQKLSFWINAYNAYTIKLVALKYPVKSIKDIKTMSTGWSSFFKKFDPTASPWKIKFIQLLGKNLSLDNIEHDIIRKKFNEPRIHFAVNCASMGCPSLLNRAFSDKNLESLLTEASKSFIENSYKNTFNNEIKTFKASKIFQWYGSDFNKKYGSFINFIKTIKPELSDLKNYKLSWNDYGWDLNEAK